MLKVLFTKKYFVSLKLCLRKKNDPNFHCLFLEWLGAMYVCVCVCVYIYIYIYREKHRERERETRLFCL